MSEPRSHPPLCLRDFEVIAAAKLPAMAYDDYRSGACGSDLMVRAGAGRDPSLPAR